MPPPPELRTSSELFFSALAGGASDLETWVIDRVTSLFEEDDIAEGRRIFAEGEQVEFVYLIRGGRVRMVRDGAPPWTIEGSWAIGIFDAILDRPYTRTAIALTNLHVARVRAEQWLELLEEVFEVARHAVTGTTRGVAALEARFWKQGGAPHATPISCLLHAPASLSFVERLGILSELPLTYEAGVQVLVDVADRMEEKTFEAGAQVLERGRSTGRAWLVVEGRVVAHRNDPDLTVTFGPGTFVGGVAGLGQAILAWDARTVERTRTLSLPLEDWFDLMEEHFDLVRATLRAMARAYEGLLDALGSAQDVIRLP
jgi:CRP-like cAMP-binding protein